MTLFKKLEDFVSMGYEVSFRREAFQFIISLSQEQNDGTKITDESQMPLQDHFTEDRIVGCLQFQLTRLDEKINSMKHIPTNQ